MSSILTSLNNLFIILNYEVAFTTVLIQVYGGFTSKWQTAGKEPQVSSLHRWLMNNTYNRISYFQLLHVGSAPHTQEPLLSLRPFDVLCAPAWIHILKGLLLLLQCISGHLARQVSSPWLSYWIKPAYKSIIKMCQTHLRCLIIWYPLI